MTDKKKWSKPELLTHGTPAEIEERGRLKGIDQCIAAIRAGVASRRTRPEYGERFCNELEALKVVLSTGMSRSFYGPSIIPKMLEAITGQPKTVESVPVAKSHLTMWDILGMRDSAARCFEAAIDKPFPRLLTDRELLELQGAPESLWKDVGPSLPPADVIFESPPCKSHSGPGPDATVDAVIDFVAQAKGIPRTFLEFSPTCRDCGMPESLHADAGGSRGLDGCKGFRQ